MGMIKRLIAYLKRPKCPNNYYCPDCIRDEIRYSIEMLGVLKEQARESGANTFVWDVTKESFDFVIDKTIKDLYTVLGEAE